MYENYFEVHHRQLTMLAGRAEQLVLADPEHVSVEQRYQTSGEEAMAMVEITAGAVTPEDMQAAFEAEDHAIDRETAEMIAQRQNRQEEAQAEVQFAFLQAGASMNYHVEQARQGLLDASVQPGPLPYGGAERHTAFPEEDLTIEITKLHNVEHVGEVAGYMLRADDGPIQHTLALGITNNRIVDVRSNVRPRDDEELRAWFKALGPAIEQVQFALIGQFEDEAALDATLHGIRQQFADTMASEDITAMLDGMRLRAMAAREAVDLSLVHPGLSLPSADVLDEWTNRLYQ